MMMRSISTIVIALSLVPAGLDSWIEHALASQGPGVTSGAAGTTTQLAMAIIVYGGSALVIAVGLIGAAWQRRGDDYPRRQ